MNKLFLVSGHSGSGKTTVMRKIMSNEIISFTTREPRVGEIEGVDYKFITVEQYEYLFKNIINFPNDTLVFDYAWNRSLSDKYKRVYSWLDVKAEVKNKFKTGFYYELN